jgi:hypothetical protein
MKTANAAFIHNKDYSGEIYIVGKDRDGKGGEVALEFKDLLEFVTRRYRAELRGKIETASLEQLVLIAEDLDVHVAQWPESDG